MNTSWHEVFSMVEEHINNRDFVRAQKMLNDAKNKAYADFIDPRWVLKELSAQEKRIQQR